MIKFIKTHKVLCIICVLVLAGVIYKLAQPKDSGTTLIPETAALRDVTTYNSFVGNVEPGKNRDVLSKVSSQVLELAVKEGDKVQEGDIIAILDSATAEYTIDMREAALRATQANYSFAVSDAQRNYDNLKETLDKDLNSTLNNAELQLNNAKKNLETAQDNYDKAKKGTYSATASLNSAVDSAYYGYLIAKENYDNAAEAAGLNTAAQTKADKATAFSAAKTELVNAVNSCESDITTLEIALSKRSELIAAHSSLEDKFAAYDDAKTASETADAAYKTIYDSHSLVLLRLQMENSNAAYSNASGNQYSTTNDTKENLKKQVDAAQTAYDNAKATYDAAKLAVDQQLATAAAALARAKGTASTETSQLELENLKNNLGDYVITAPCDGTITTLTLKEGSIAGMSVPAAVISDLDSMKISIKVDEYSILNTHVGAPVTIFIDSIKRSYEGTITYIADMATIEGGVSYFKATVTFDADEFVRGGMSVEVRLTNVDEKDAVTVSVNAIRYHEDNTAYVLVGESAKNTTERPVTLGPSDGSFVIITDGLSKDDVVWVTPRFGFDFMMGSGSDMWG